MLQVYLIKGPRGIACAGGADGLTTAELWGAPVQGAPYAAWTWRGLPSMSVGRGACRGCVLSDGRFAVFGGMRSGACSHVLMRGTDTRW